MIKEFFGFSELPFSNTPDPTFFFPTTDQRKALNSLFRGVTDKKGFLVLTGDVGTGKTTLCRTLLRGLGKWVDTALVLNPDLSEVEILRAILRDFGLDDDGSSKHALMERLYGFLVKRAAKSRSTLNERTALIVIDDAQNLPPRSLEQVRMISNFETDKEKLVQILLVGQPELADRLDSHKLRQVKQRIAVREHLQPLTSSEAQQYVAQRLFHAGGNESRDIFTRKALRAIHHETGGYPRSVNTLCDHLLTEAYKRRRKIIDAPTVREAALSIGLCQPPLARFREKWAALKWHTAAALTFVAAIAALAYLPIYDRPSASEFREQALWERRFISMEDTLSAVGRKLQSMNDLDPEAGPSEASPRELQSQPAEAEEGPAELKRKLEAKETALKVLQQDLAAMRQGRKDPLPLEKHEAELRKTIATLKEKHRSKEHEVQRFEEELEQLRRRVLQQENEKSEMAQNLREKDHQLASTPAGTEHGETLMKLEELQAENSALQEQQRLMERMASGTIKNQSSQIERLSLERKKLLETLKMLKDGNASIPADVTTLLSSSLP